MSTKDEKIKAQSDAFLGKPDAHRSRHIVGPSELRFLLEQAEELQILKKELKELASRAESGLNFEQKVDYLNAHHLKAHHD